MSAPGPSSGDGLPAASLGESVRFALSGLVPPLVRGLFSPRPWAMRLLSAVDGDGRTVAALSGLRRRHGGQGVRLFGGRLVTLWGEPAIREVLDHSAERYGSDAGAKGKGMAHFQPDALTVSRGEEWRDRRAFAESVLASSQRVHPAGERFVSVVAEEVAYMDLRGRLRWAEWESLFDHLTLRIVFGDGARGDQELTGVLETLMKEANRLVGAREGSDRFHELHAKLERRLLDPEPGSLIARFADAPQSDRTRIVHQIPHWMFAMRDTLGANAYRALAAIVADPAVESRVREELDAVELDDPAAVQGLSYLEGCLEETMRLWPTVPLIAREATQDVTLAGEALPEGTQVMILNTFNHRDPEHVPDADRLAPERWTGEERDYRFNHLSNGSQYCPAIPLLMLLGKAVLARVLDGRVLTLRGPVLTPGKPLPGALDFYRLSFDVREGQPAE